MVDRPGLSSKWIVGSLVAVLIGVAIWASGLGSNLADMLPSTLTQSQDGTEKDAEAAEKALQATPDTVAPAIDATGAGTPAAVQMAPAEETPGPAVSDAGTAVVSSAPAAETAPTSQAALSTAGTPGPATGGGNALKLNVREESWVEIRRASDKRVVFSRLMKAGESESFDVNEPVAIVLGNAKGVDMTLRGEPLVLKSGTRNNVARLNVK